VNVRVLDLTLCGVDSLLLGSKYHKNIWHISFSLSAARWTKGIYEAARVSMALMEKPLCFLTHEKKGDEACQSEVLKCLNGHYIK
jgi:hypothetical protein